MSSRIPLDRIIASTPANKTAARVTSKGTHWAPEKDLIKPWDAWRDTPLPVRVLPPYVHTHQGFEDFTGRRIGRFKIIGMAPPRETSNDKKARWVVRCACGMYGHQTARALRSDTARHRCPNCDYLEELKAGRIQRPTVAERIARSESGREDGAP